jgi:hypothetical protein
VTRPFVWQIQVRREVLDEEMARLRNLPYTFWKDLVGGSISKSVMGRDNKTYRVTVTPEPLAGTDGDIRISLSLARDALFRRRLLRQEFVITRDNEFRV